AIIARGVARSGGKATAVKRDEDGTFGPIIHSRRPHVERQAVFAGPAGLLVPLDHHSIFAVEVCWCLGTNLPVGKAFAHAGPGRWLPGRHEPVLATGGRPVRNALELFDSGSGNTLHFAGGSIHYVENRTTRVCGAGSRTRGS